MISFIHRRTEEEEGEREVAGGGGGGRYEEGWRRTQHKISCTETFE